ncbi:TPA: hypothetical protein REF75_001615 [Staphylococcus pseudintermedius]|nr:hypothetical protein [Staphylococcus pseudintermedius]EGQ3284618.1 hypothetical protein [Staphylococcus pseudintermedius]MDK4170365.1 hypothetical protein [Staphylococcus pseudintermedius]HDT9061752.1 hypothetical protein [Staphylococcus pseudintermedius]
MNNEFVNSITEVALSLSNLSVVQGELERLSKLSGGLEEQVKAYVEEGDHDGANAIMHVLNDDIRSEVLHLYPKYEELYEVYKKKMTKFKNVCTFYGYPIPSDNIITFPKGENE